MQRRFLQTLSSQVSHNPASISMMPRNGVIGSGISIRIPDDLKISKVWKALLIEIKQPHLFLPATQVKCRLTDDGLGTFREMVVGREHIKESIYASEESREVRYSVEGKSIEKIHAITQDKETGIHSVEIYQQHPITKERIQWHASKAPFVAAIEKMFEMARKI